MTRIQINPEYLILINIDELEFDESMLLQLSYPKPNNEYARLVCDSLRQLGVEGVYIDKSSKLMIVGKGFRNIVVACRHRGEFACAKIRRIDYVVKDTSREASMLRLANSVKVGPRLIGHHGPVLLMELVEGEDLTSWLLSLSKKEFSYAREIVSELLKQCHRLDMAGINHDELSDASKHVLKTRSGVVILDFGSANITSKPSNLTSIINYLFHGPARRVSTEIIGIREPPAEVLRNYKSNLSSDSFENIYRIIFNV